MMEILCQLGTNDAEAGVVTVHHQGGSGSGGTSTSTHSTSDHSSSANEPRTPGSHKLTSDNATKSLKRPSTSFSKEELIEKVSAIQACTSTAVTQLLQKKDKVDSFANMLAAQLRLFKNRTTRMQVQLELQTHVLQRLTKEDAVAQEHDIVVVEYQNP
jgi:hypothetical protein